MASIVKRRNRYSVVYRYIDEMGVERQRWETFDTNADAKKRKAAVEFEQENGTFIAPTAKTVSDLLEDFMSIYGLNTWAMSTYESNRGLILNYVNPIIGDMKLEDITPRTMDLYFKDLQKVKSKFGNRKPSSEYPTPGVIHSIHKLLRCAFNQAIKWELMSRNPVLNASLPRTNPQKRDIWDAETLFRAIELCDDPLLALSLNISFCCSLRMGEMLGLTWDCVDISDESIAAGRASIYVDKELQRVTRQAYEDLNAQGVIKVFPPQKAQNNTVLLLKEPKTKSSVRKVFMPSTVAKMLLDRKKECNDYRELFGIDYHDYNLVFANSIGNPIEGRTVTKHLHELIEKNNLPPVVFHSLRHSSITYKLKLNGGDMKSVQGDSGHSQVKMVADVYSHIIDEDRVINAQLFEERFYHGGTTPKSEALAEVQSPTQTPMEAEGGADAELIAKLLANPTMAALLKNLAKDL